MGISTWTELRFLLHILGATEADSNVYSFQKVDLCGYMHFWGLTIDVISAVDIIIAIGLCVDYAGK